MTVEIRRKFSVVLAAVIAVVFGLVAFVAPAANAAPGGDPDEQVNTANIDPSQQMSLTIHKHEQPETQGSPATGEAQDVSTKGLNGVRFTVKKVDLDLSKSANWDKIKDLKVAADGAVTLNKEDVQLTDVTPATKTTERVGGEDGVAKWTDLEMGVYVVTEGEAPAKLGIVQKAAPFLVVLPMPTQDKSAWNYEVNVYPKNSLANAEKKVDDSEAFKAGDDVLWTVYSVVPAGTTFQNYSVSDTFDKRLEFVSIESVQLVKRGETADADEPLNAPDPVLAETDYESSTSGNPVTITMKSGGLEKLGKVPNGTYLKVVYKTKVKPVDKAEIGDGTIENTATVNINNVKFTPKDKTKWGDFTIYKTDANGTNKPLKDAEFAIYKKNPSEQGFNEETDLVKKVTTGNDGTFKIRLKAGQYWVKETKAPAGYVLEDKATPVTIVAGETTEQANRLDATNTKQTVPGLPLTGASGQLLMMVGGLAIILMGAGVGLVAYKRNRA